MAMARTVPEDPYAGLADPSLLARDWPALDLVDAAEPDAESLMAHALEAEDAARAVAGVTNSEGASAGWRRREVTLVTSDGFAGCSESGSHSVSAAALAGEGTAMERDYWWSSAVHEADLEEPASVGRRAGERAVRRLGARKAQSGQVPVVYDPRIAGGLLSHLTGAISGPSIARGTSFLKDALETQVVRARYHRRGRPAAGAGLALPPLRRRGRGDGTARGRRGRSAQDVAARQPLRTAARPRQHRPRGARHRRAALARLHQPLAGTGA